MFSPKIRLSRTLHARLEQAAAKAGYSSVEEFVIHVLEREVEGLEDAGRDEEVEKQLRGLGYIE